MNVTKQCNFFYEVTSMIELGAGQKAVSAGFQPKHLCLAIAL